MLKNIIILALFSTSFLFLSCKQQEDVIITHKALNPIAQNKSERIWKSVHLDTIINLRIPPPIIYEPGKCKVDNRDNIYVMDQQLNSVIQFSPTGEFIRKFGYGRGSGPGEILNPADFSIGKDGKVYIADNGNFSISVFDSNSVFNRIIKVNHAAGFDKILILEENKYLIRDYDLNSFFKVINDTGKILYSFGRELFSSEQETVLPFDVFLCSGRDGVLGTFVRAGYIFGYSSDLKNIFYRETMDRIRFPELNKKSNVDKTIISIDPFSPVVNWDISYSGQKENIVFISPGDFSKREHALVFDAYSAKDGEYLYSFKINRPNNIGGVSSYIVKGDYIYLTAFGENTLICKFKFYTK